MKKANATRTSRANTASAESAAVSRNASGGSFLNATGPLSLRLTNDYLFKRMLEKNEEVLRELIRTLLHLSEGDITDLNILNPFLPGDTITDRRVILDVNVEINHHARINLEMQVVNYLDWPERSLYYACRNYLNLVRGKDYDLVAPSIQIGFLDYTLFRDHPSFCYEVTSCQALFLVLKDHIVASPDGIPKGFPDSTVPGLDHSVIRGFGFRLTDRSMVRRERYSLLAWITVSCANIERS